MPFKPYNGESTPDLNFKGVTPSPVPGFKPYTGESVPDPNYVDKNKFVGAPKVVVDESSGLNDAVNQTQKMFFPGMAAVEAANKIPGVQDYIPDALVDIGSGGTKGIIKGGYNALRNTAQLAADVEDYIIPGDTTPVSDLLSNIPEAKYDGTTEKIAGNITEIASGLLLGNKAGAVAKTGQLGDDAVKLATKLAPDAAKKLIAHGADLIKNGLQGIAGTAVTTAPGSTNLGVGKDALLGSLIDGLPTDSPDAAQNALAARINTALDGFITGASIGEVAKGLRALSKITIGPAILDKLSPIWSETARIREFFNQIGEEAQKIPGVDTPEGLQKFHERATELAGNPEAGVLKRDLGVSDVPAINEKLDTATTVSRQITKDSPDLDVGIRNTLEAQSKKLGQKGYEKTAGRREAPTSALNNALEQTEAALGGPAAAEAGARDVQRLGRAEVTQGMSEGKLAKTEVSNITDNITQHVSREREVTGKQVDELFDTVPADAKYDPVSLTKIMAEEKDVISPEVKEMLTAKANDGSFKYLNKKVKTRVNSMITKLERLDVRTHPQQLELAALKRIKKNIAEDQIKHLEDIGRSDVIQAAKTAQEAWESRTANNRQGVVEDLQNIEDANPFKLDNIKSKSHDALIKEIGNLEHPSHEKRLRELLSTDEGGRSEALIEQYKNAKNKVDELDKIEEEVYGNKLREFYDQRSPYPGAPAPEGVTSFQQLLEDPQNGDRIKYMIDLAEKEGSPAVKQALKYSYARALKKKLYTGHQTELGNPVTNAPGVQGVLSNDAFIKAGDQIYSDTPEFMTAVKDTLELANEIQKASYKRGAPKGGADMIVSTAEKGLKTGISPILGPLSHKGYIIKTYFRAALDILKPQVAIDRMADALMADGAEYAKAYDILANPKASPKKIEKSIKYLSMALLRTNGEREQFDKKFKQLKTENQTEEVLKK